MRDTHIYQPTTDHQPAYLRDYEQRFSCNCCSWIPKGFYKKYYFILAGITTSAGIWTIISGANDDSGPAIAGGGLLLLGALGFLILFITHCCYEKTKTFSDTVDESEQSSQDQVEILILQVKFMHLL